MKMVVFWLRLTTFVTSAAHWSPGQAPSPPINFARNSPATCSNIEFASLELQRFWGVSKNDHDKLRAKCGGGGVVAARGHRQPGPVGQAARLSETPVAFAGTGRASTETGIAFAGAGRASTETGIAFAGEKWAFLVRFSVALVMVVSMVAFQRRALVMMVSRWPASVAAEVSLVSTSPRGCVCARKSSPCVAWWWVSARKSSPFVFIMAQNWCFRACRANFFAEMPLEARCRASFFADRQ